MAKRLLTAQRQTEAAAAVPYATTSAKTPVTARRVGAPAGAQLALSVTEHRRQQVAVVHDLVDPAWRGQRERRSSSSIGGKSFKFMAHDPVTVSCQQHARNAAANPLSKVDARKPTKQTCAADDPKKTGLDRKLIALNEPHEVRSWTESLGVDVKTLKAAVAAVGNSAEKVREYLKKKK